ncbi:hypothetical protein AYO44_02425 [Planctomycetaceae bacterium SCGC AG-212-F19]|nr:hypothetical protein AYO44_02425 [Planctomycetaceae bacterium SCGC AG-212-F19]
MENLDGSLFCDGCAWDLMGIESTPGEPAPAPAAAPAAEAAPAMAVEAAAMPLADVPMAVSASQVRQPTGARPATAAPAAAPPASQVRQPTGARPATAAPPGAPPVSQVKQPTVAPPPVSQVKQPTAAQPAPTSQVRQPTGAKVPSMLGAAAAPAGAPRPASPTVARLHPEAVAKLVVVRGVKMGVEFPVYEGANFIGRFDEAPVDIDLTGQEDKNDVWTSRQHACVTWENGGLVIEDLKSQNGTFVNRTKLTPGEKKPLKERDIVQVGTVQFAVKL